MYLHFKQFHRLGISQNAAIISRHYQWRRRRTSWFWVTVTVLLFTVTNF